MDKSECRTNNLKWYPPPHPPLRTYKLLSKTHVDNFWNSPDIWRDASEKLVVIMFSKEREGKYWIERYRVVICNTNCIMTVLAYSAFNDKQVFTHGITCTVLYCLDEKIFYWTGLLSKELGLPEINGIVLSKGRNVSSESHQTKCIELNPWPLLKHTGLFVKKNWQCSV